MEFDIGVIKRHPYLLGGIVLVIGGYVFYRIYKSGASPTDLSSEAQFQALQSAQQLQNSQIQGQLDLQSGQASAQIAVINASYAGQIDLAKQGQRVYDDYLKTQTDLATIDSTTQVGVATIQANATTDVTRLQAGAAVDITQIQAAVNLAAIDVQAQRVQAAELLGMATIAPTFSITSTRGDVVSTIQGTTGKGAYDEARGKAADIVAAFLGSSSYSGTTPAATGGKSFSVGIPGLGGFSIGGL